MTFHFERSYRGPVKALVLDWAGTTVDFGCCAPAVVFVDVFRRRGVEISLAEARGPMGVYKHEHIRQLTELPAIAARWQAAHGRTPNADDVNAMYEDFVPLQLDVIARYAAPVPGCVEAVAAFRDRGLQLGSTTGYSREMVDVLAPEAAARGYAPDVVVCATEVPAGRPEPWMALRAVEALRVFPVEACVKVGDTVPDIAEGLNAGMWTIGVAVTGNEVGLPRDEWEALPSEQQARLRERAYARLHAAGAHYVVDSIADVPAVLDDIDARLAKGERP